MFWYLSHLEGVMISFASARVSASVRLFDSLHRILLASVPKLFLLGVG